MSHTIQLRIYISMLVSHLTLYQWSKNVKGNMEMFSPCIFCMHELHENQVHLQVQQHQAEYSRQNQAGIWQHDLVESVQYHADHGCMKNRKKRQQMQLICVLTGMWYMCMHGPECSMITSDFTLCQYGAPWD